MRLLFISLNIFIQQVSVSTQPLDTFPVLDSLFPKQSLNPAFEKHPLLSRISENDECTEEEISTVGISHDSTILVNGQNFRLQDLRMYQATQLIQMSDLDRLVQQPEIKYEVVKKVWKDGQEWAGVLQPDQVDSILKISAALQLSYSLVVSRMHQQWGTISAIARKMESEAQFPRVSSNLYLTPPNASAFDSHWDYMDVIVVQVIGKKYWNVAKSPTVYLSTEELKRKPTIEEVSKPHYPMFLMQPGDALYIPRGFLHNASTAGLDEGSSLHLTFGLEPMTATVEDLINFVFNAKFHTIIHEKAAENGYSVFRQSVPLYDSWRTIEDSRRLFEEALQEIDKLADQMKDSTLAEASNAATSKFDVAFAEFSKHYSEFRKAQHKQDNISLERAGFSA